jgi:hypothetical protein
MEFEKGSAANKGNGEWYPRGYSVDQRLISAMEYPLVFEVGATSNVKQVETLPTVEAHLALVVTEQGALIVKAFGMGRGKRWVFDER